MNSSSEIDCNQSLQMRTRNIYTSRPPSPRPTTTRSHRLHSQQRAMKFLRLPHVSNPQQPRPRKPKSVLGDRQSLCAAKPVLRLVPQSCLAQDYGREGDRIGTEVWWYRGSTVSSTTLSLDMVKCGCCASSRDEIVVRMRDAGCWIDQEASDGLNLERRCSPGLATHVSRGTRSRDRLGIWRMMMIIDVEDGLRNH